MRQIIYGLQVLGVALLLLLSWAFQTTHTTSEIENIEKLSYTLFKQGQYKAALTKVLEAKILYEKAKNWEKVVKCLRDAHFYAGYLSSYNNESYLRQAIIFSDQKLSNTYLEKGITYRTLGKWYYHSEMYDSSIVALKTAIEVFDNLKEREQQKRSIITLTSAYYFNDELDSMYAYLLEAEQIAKQHQLSSTVIYSSIGLYYYTTSDIEKAIYYNNLSIQLQENIEDKSRFDSLALANTYNNQGLNYIEHFNLQRAAYCFLQTLDILQAIGQHFSEYIDVHINYIEVLSQLEQHNKSLALLNSIKDIKKSDYSEQEYITHKETIYDLFIRNYFALSNLDSAAFYIDKLINLYGDESLTPPSILILKGRLFFYQKNYQAAEKIITSITAKYEKEYVDLNKRERNIKYNNIVITYLFLGKTLHEQGKYKAALQAFQKSLAINIPNSNINKTSSIDNAFKVDIALETLHQKAIILEAINTKESKLQALNTYQLAIEWMERIRQNMAFDASKENLNTFSDIYTNAVSLAAELYQKTNKTEYLASAFEWSEKEKAVILLDNLIGEQRKMTTNVPKDLLEQEASLKRNLTFFQQKRLELESDKESQNYQRNEQHFTAANIQLAKLKDTLQTYYQSYFNLTYQSSLATIPAVQQDLLQPQQALIQYFTTDSLFYVFVIDKDNSQLVTIPKGEKESQLLQALQANLQQANATNQTEQENFQTFADLAYQGYQTILEPIISRLPTDVKELIIIPDAALNYLPFEVLLREAVTTKKVDYLTLPYALHDYQFHYGYSGTLLLENQRQYQQLETNDKILAYAPPYQSSEPIAQRGSMRTLRSGIAQLKGTAKEIQAIANYFEGEFDCSPTATKANFTEQVSDFGILHLAMHGQPSLENPNNAHLVFSNLDNETDKANLLHHYEITALKTQAQLAVLSACETGVGKEIEGEGVMSLGRGFMYAGIPSIVMSLWKMNDQSTSELMPLFYKNLSEGMRKDKALHQAKLAYLKNALPEQAHPFYWSGFVSLGDAQPIKSGYSVFSMRNIGLGLLVFFLCVLVFWWYGRGRVAT